jgi:hypothetical protein
MGGMGGTGPALDLQTIIQAVTRNNPGAPPGVIARAVNSAIPLMNAQAQMEWRQMQAELRMQQQQMNFMLGAGRLGVAERAVDVRESDVLDRVNQRRRDWGLPEFKSVQDMEQQLRGGAPAAPAAPGAPGAKPGAPGAPGAEPGAKPETEAPVMTPFGPRYTWSTIPPEPPAGGPQAIAWGIVKGQRPPETRGLGSEAKGVNNILSNQYPFFNLAKADLDWKKAVKLQQTLGGPGITRWSSTAHSALNTIKDVLADAHQLNLQGYSLINRAQLIKWTENEPNSPRGRLARDYIIKVGLLQSEMATLEQGANAPTQDAWEVAKQTIKAEWAVGQVEAAAKALPDIIGYRLNAFDQITGGSFGTPSPYMSGSQPGGPPAAPGAPGGAPAPGTTPPLQPGQIQLKPGVRMTPPTPQSQPFEPFAD